MRPSNIQKVVTAQIADRVTLDTDGTGSDRYVLCTNDMARTLEALGPWIGSIRVATLTENRTSAHRWYVVVQGSVDNKTWSTAVNLNPYLSANGQTLQPDYTNLDNLAWPYLRFSLACSNLSGSSRESAIVSAWLIVTFKS